MFQGRVQLRAFIVRREEPLLHLHAGAQPLSGHHLVDPAAPNVSQELAGVGDAFGRRLHHHDIEHRGREKRRSNNFFVVEACN